MIGPEYSEIVRTIQTVMPEPHASLVAGMCLGYRQQLPVALTDVLVRSGTIHIVALSGFNITLLIQMVMRTVLPFFGRKISCIIALLFICWFVWFVGFGPSVVRAAIMGAMTLVAVVFGRMYWPILTLALTALVMLIPDPTLVTDISYQLSFAASLGIILFSNRPIDEITRMGKPSLPTQQSQHEQKEVLIHSKYILFRLRVSDFVNTTVLNALRGGWQWVREELTTTIAAQVFTVPLILWYFHRVSLVAPIANLAIGWIVPYITVFGLLVGFGGWLWWPIGYVVGVFTYVLVEYLLRVITLFSGLPFASLGG